MLAASDTTLVLVRACAEADAETTAEQVVRKLASSNVTIRQVCHAEALPSSALARALAQRWGASRRHLAPLDRGADPALLTELQALASQPIAICADEPLVSELVAWLVLGLPQVAHRSMLAPGAVVWLEGLPMPGNMALRAHLTPAMLASP